MIARAALFQRAVFLALVFAPVALWWLVKPVRVIAPEWAGVRCIADDICIDAPSRKKDARALYTESLRHVTEVLGAPDRNPRVIFCATESCYHSFGFGRSVAHTLGTSAIVLSPRAWKPHFLRHEMIHHVQNERLGNLHTWLFTPEWFLEGMAYSLSDDPRPRLDEPWQSHRTKYENWYRAIDKERLWEEAAKL